MWPWVLLASVVCLCATSLKGWAMWLASKPACTAEEFAKVVRQLNVLTEGFADVQVTADSVRTAVGMSKIARK